MRRHLEETERQAEMIEKRLEVLGGKPKRVKDAIMALGVTPPPAAGGRAPGAGTMFAT